MVRAALASGSGRTRTAVAAALAALIALCAGLLLRGADPALGAPGDKDNSFSGDGIAELGANTRLLAAVVQPDGKLVAVGEQGSGASSQALIVRFTAGGGLDRSFSGDGIALGGAGTSARGVALDGAKIVVAGTLTTCAGHAGDAAEPQRLQRQILQRRRRRHRAHRPRRRRLARSRFRAAR